jgi:hypothetical protein
MWAESDWLEIQCVPLVPAGAVDSIEQLQAAGDDLALAHIDAWCGRVVLGFRDSSSIGPLWLGRQISGVDVDFFGRLLAADVTQQVFQFHRRVRSGRAAVGMLAVRGEHQNSRVYLSRQVRREFFQRARQARTGK